MKKRKTEKMISLKSMAETSLHTVKIEQKEISYSRQLKKTLISTRLLKRKTYFTD